MLRKPETLDPFGVLVLHFTSLDAQQLIGQ